ncbi:SGNH/GDSL hydrolase family protein [Vibrio salilacus]|uniref:SGNH/GDSL hydrolase family protein n=1 Tax=Vibrio salilacus TaxID=1323749 RepID=UPI000C2A7FFB|nr:SGNH/GDSL hydrolase family protein [Vibrio salilacus]
MKSTLLILASIGLINSTNILAEEPLVSVERINGSELDFEHNKQTYTFVRCWYRPAQTHDDPATSWEWALDKNGDYYTIEGYWWSSVSLKNMFYTTTSQQTIKQRCEETLDVDHDTADILYYAADHRLSYNHSIWTNEAHTGDTVNRIVAFGDSLSDTGNLFNGSQWVFPNSNSWFLGHFSNGLVWTEYLAKSQQLPVYNWAVGGAAGTNQYVALTGIYDQVTSYLTYMEKTKNYDPANVLFTLAFGLNDFINYNREVRDVKADLSSALIRLTDSGAQHLILLTLPDATKAPQYKYSTQQEIDKVQAKIVEFNQFIAEQAQLYTDKGVNVLLFDTYTLFEQITSNPQQHGFENATDACLDINRSSAKDYLLRHNFTNDCAYHGSDKYVFWGVTHPTTAVHKYIADNIIANDVSQFPF